MKVKIILNGTETEAELNDTKTAKRIYEALPLEAEISYWGDEIYFEIPVKCQEENATVEVEKGDLGYWLEGSCFCIFYGKTPASTSDKPRAASPVNVFGKVKDCEIFKKIRAKGVRVERV